jgi:monoamine oxidase
MAARELGKAGKKVVILEARDRIGGRIMPLDEVSFGYPAQGGAEWVHGEAPITRDLIKEAGLTMIPEDGELWSVRNGELSPHRQFVQNNALLKEKLEALKEDISIFDFLEQNFGDDSYKNFRNSVIKMVEGYDAADPKLMSTLTLKDGWLLDSKWDDGRIKEGYGALVDFLEKECTKYGVEIVLGMKVKSVGIQTDSVLVHADCGIETLEYEAEKVVVTVPLPVLDDIHFNPEIQSVLESAKKIGFGNVIKIVIKFKTRFWEHACGKDMTKMAFLLTNEKFLTWWSQYPVINTVLTGWMAGPEAANYKDSSSEELLDMAITSLAKVLKMEKEVLVSEVELFEVVNWPNDPLAKGSYSYTTVHTKDAYEKLATPIADCIFFAGEAAYAGDATATVEGALGSGKEAASKILIKNT